MLECPFKLWSINVHLGLLQPDVEFVWWWGGWWGLQSHFRVQPNCSAEVEVVLCCVVVGVVTIELG